MDPQWTEPRYNQRTIFCLPSPDAHLPDAILLHNVPGCFLALHSTAHVHAAVPSLSFLQEGTLIHGGSWNSPLAVLFPKLLGMPFPWVSFHGEMMVVTAQTMLESVLPVTPYDWLHSCVWFSLLEVVKTNLVYQTSAISLEPAWKCPYRWGEQRG